METLETMKSQEQERPKKKRPYVKPTMRFEAFDLERPYATNCMADKDDMNDLIELGYFTDEMNCMFLEETREHPILAKETKKSGHDTICYHSNVIAAFIS
ncbi:MAG: hypothetical protein MJ097_01605 [Dorea sp.]|nr:hypothetical protein [Dorea sp.]